MSAAKSTVKSIPESVKIEPKPIIEPDTKHFEIPVTAKFTLISLIVIAIIIVISIIIIHKEQSKRSNTEHMLKVYEDEREQSKQQLEQQENIINNLNNKIHDIQEELNAKKSGRIIDGDLTNMPSYKSPSNIVLDDGGDDTKQLKVKPMTRRDAMMKQINSKRTTVEDTMFNPNTEAVQQAQDDDAEEQIKQLVPEDKIIEEDIPIQGLDKQEIIH